MQNVKTFVLGLLFWVALGAAQPSARDYLAHFRYSDPMPRGTSVQLRLSVRLWNMGENDLSGGTLRFHERRDTTARVDAFTSVFVSKHSSKLLRGYLIISAAELRDWEEGHTPRLTLEFVDPEGNLRDLPVDLSRMMGAEDEN